MKILNLLTKTVLLSVLLVSGVLAQSRDQNYPTGVEGPEISGSIKARDIGDPRLTSYFYAFDGSQGDIFINVLTRNFTGDVDIFTRDAMRTLTKMVIFGDGGQQLETGRVVYLRKPERLILRVQGRTPNDEPATFQVKFAGSFVAVRERDAVDVPTIAREDTPERPSVNTVGTIVARPPAAAPGPLLPKAAAELPRVPPPQSEPKPITSNTAKIDSPSAEEKKPEVVVKSGVREPTAVRTLIRPGRRTAPARQPLAVKAPPAPDPLASINLKIELKAGGEILRPLNEVLRFTVDKGVLTVIMKTGAITRYSMVTEVSRVTIE